MTSHLIWSKISSPDLDLQGPSGHPAHLHSAHHEHISDYSFFRSVCPSHPRHLFFLQPIKHTLSWYLYIYCSFLLDAFFSGISVTYTFFPLPSGVYSNSTSPERTSLVILYETTFLFCFLFLLSIHNLIYDI